MKFNKKASLLLDRCTIAAERGYWIARIVKLIIEELFVPRRMIR
jgi:hypothetical protein